MLIHSLEERLQNAQQPHALRLKSYTKSRLQVPEKAWFMRVRSLLDPGLALADERLRDAQDLVLLRVELLVGGHL